MLSFIYCLNSLVGNHRVNNARQNLSFLLCIVKKLYSSILHVLHISNLKVNIKYLSLMKIIEQTCVLVCDILFLYSPLYCDVFIFVDYTFLNLSMLYQGTTYSENRNKFHIKQVTMATNHEEICKVF